MKEALANTKEYLYHLLWKIDSFQGVTQVQIKTTFS